jgi:hypothetical protein
VVPVAEFQYYILEVPTSVLGNWLLDISYTNTALYILQWAFGNPIASSSNLHRQPQPHAYNVYGPSLATFSSNLQLQYWGRTLTRTFQFFNVEVTSGKKEMIPKYR